MSKLVVFRGDAVEHEIRLTGHTVSIGRDARNDIVLDDSLKNLSRFHAEVRAESGRYFIVDLKSRNGVWMNGRRIDAKAELALGAPVTLGAYELVLEDDVSTGEFGDVSATPQQTDVKSAPAGPARPARQTRARTREWSLPPVAASKRQALLWSAVAVAVLLIAVVAFAVVRSRASQREMVAAVDPPPPPPAPLPMAGLREIEDPRKGALQEHLVAARKATDDRDVRGALRDHVLPVLDVIALLAFSGEPVDFDAEKQQALQLKKEAEAGLTAPPAPPPPAPAPPTPPPCLERTGIVRRLNESCTDYDARAQRIAVNLREGNRYLDIEDFANALARFRLVDGDQKGYSGIDLRITETMDKQRKAVDLAMSNGQQAEQAGNRGRARQWYKTAVTADPATTAARDRANVLLNGMNADAKKLFDAASLNRKLGNKEAARRQFQQVVDLMLPEDEIRIMAGKELEALGK